MFRRNAVLLVVAFVLGPVWLGAGVALGAGPPPGPADSVNPLVTVSTATPPVPLTQTPEAPTPTDEPLTVATDVVDDSVDDATDTVTDTAGGATDTAGGATDTVDNTTDDAADAVNGTADAINDTVRTVTGDVTDTTNLTSTLNSSVNASIAAEFGFVLRNTPSLAVPGVTAGEQNTPTDTPQRTGEGAGSATPRPASSEQPSAGGPPTATGRAAASRGGGIPLDDVPVGPVGTAAVGAVVLAILARNAASAGLHPGLGTVLSRPSLGSTLRATANWGTGWFWRLLGAFGYSRYDDSDPLDHAVRADLYGQIVDAPGTYLSEASHDVGVPISTARHHFRILEAENLVTGSMIRGKRRYFPIGTDDVDLAAALADEAPAAVLRTLFRLGPSSVTALADELDRDVSTLTHHLNRLEEAGLVDREREGRAVVNRLSPAADEWFRADAPDGTAADAATD